MYKADWAAANSMEDMDVTHHRTYRYGADAVVAFGSGQSLTSFALSFGKTDTHLTPPGMAEIPTASGATAGGGTTYEVKVTNTGRLVGDEIVMAYFVPTAIGLKCTRPGACSTSSGRRTSLPAPASPSRSP